MGNVIKTTAPPPDNITACQTGTESDFLAVLCDYPSPDVSEPIFQLGEKLRVISDEGGWWRVRSLRTGRENYIPGKCVAKVYHGWLFDGVGREKSEELLQLPDTKTGSFMIRQSETKKGTYSLSVRHRQVKHYRIFRLPNNWYYVSPRLTFQCLEHLVNHYSESADGLCCVLTMPCLAQTRTEDIGALAVPVVKRRKQFDWKSMKRVPLTTEEATMETDDMFLSYGLRESIASYLSLAEEESFPPPSDKKKKNRQSQVLLNVNKNSMPFRSSYSQDYT
ncbi:src-like-adapter [Bombina bombina]|uniref:src-like-adapter n=1 Tax=Bombina bombina TaxID=8345 RepID=UPI00235B045A|nr:src-like-adapter [Bombina bombina]